MKKIYKIGTGIMTTGLVTAAIVTPIVVLNNASNTSAFPTYGDEIGPNSFVRDNTVHEATSDVKTNQSGSTYSSTVGPLKITSDDGLLFGFDNLDEITKWVYKNVPMGPEQRTIQSITLNHGSVFENGVINLGGHSGKKKGFNISLSPVFLMENNRLTQTIQQLSYSFFKNDDVKSIFGLSGDDLAYRKMITPEAKESQDELDAPLSSGVAPNIAYRNGYAGVFNQLFTFLLNDMNFMGGSITKGSSRVQLFKDFKNDLKNVTSTDDKVDLIQGLFSKPVEYSFGGPGMSLTDQLSMGADRGQGLNMLLGAFNALTDKQVDGLCEAFSSNQFIRLIEDSYQPFDIIDTLDPDGPNGESAQWIFDLQTHNYLDNSRSADILNYSQADGAFKFGDNADIKKAFNMLLKQYDVTNKNLDYKKRKTLLMSILSLFLTSKGSIFEAPEADMPDDLFLESTFPNPGHNANPSTITTKDISFDKVMDKVRTYVETNKKDVFENLNGDKLFEIIETSLPFTKKRLKDLDAQSRDLDGTLQSHLNTKFSGTFKILEKGDSLYRSMVRRSSYELLPIIAHEYGHHMTITHTTQAGVAMDDKVNPGVLTDKIMRSVETVSTAEESDLIDTDKYKLFQSLFPQELKNVIDKTSDYDDQTDIINNVARKVFSAPGYFGEMSKELLDGAGGQVRYKGSPSRNPSPLTLIYATSNDGDLPPQTSLLDFYNFISKKDWVANGEFQSFGKYFPTVKDEQDILPAYKVVFDMYKEMVSDYQKENGKLPIKISSQLINQYLSKTIHDNTHKMMEVFNNSITKDGKTFRENGVTQFGDKLFELLKASFAGNHGTVGVLSVFDKTNGDVDVDTVVSQAKEYIKNELPDFNLDEAKLKQGLEAIWTETVDGEQVDKTPFSVPGSLTDPVVTKFLINSKEDYEYVGRSLTATPMYGTDSTSMARYVFTYYESLTRIWQLLSLPYERELLITSAEVTNTDLARFAQFGLRFYDDNTHKINALGEEFVKMYASFFDLDKKISLINRSPNDGKFTFSGHFDNSEKYNGLLFMEHGKVVHEEDMILGVENINYNKVEGVASSATSLTDSHSWMTKNMVIGDFKNADLKDGKYELAFWDDQNGDGIVDAAEIIYVKNKETSENGEMNNNGYIDTNAAVEGNPEHTSLDDNFEIEVHGVLI